MPSLTPIPILSRPETRPIKRHRTVRDYAHRVRESLTTRVSMIVCSIFLGILLVLGLVTFVLWLSLRPHRPRFFVQEFTIPGLGQPTGFENAQISFNVTARNSNQNIGFYYDTGMTGTLYYRDQQIGSSPLLDPFYQGPKNTTIIDQVLSGATLTVNSQRWMEFMIDRTQGTVVFRLDITSAIRFNVARMWTSKRHRMHANCDVSVVPDGTILSISRNRRCPVYFT